MPHIHVRSVNIIFLGWMSTVSLYTGRQDAVISGMNIARLAGVIDIDLHLL
jgi:hypothetical protein